MAAAYVYAKDGGAMPRELYILNCIDRFGVMATLGRPVLGIKEMRCMGIAENVTTWYSDRQKAASWTIWATENPDKSTALTVAHNLALQLGLLKD